MHACSEAGCSRTCTREEKKPSADCPRLIYLQTEVQSLRIRSADEGMSSLQTDLQSLQIICRYNLQMRTLLFADDNTNNLQTVYSRGPVRDNVCAHHFVPWSW